MSEVSFDVRRGVSFIFLVIGLILEKDELVGFVIGAIVA